MANRSSSATLSANASDPELLVFEHLPLPYGVGDLQPVLSAETLQIHHGRHHARYVETLNRLLSEQNFSAPSLEEIIRIAHGSRSHGLFNNAAQAWNHSFFWQSMSPSTSAPSAPLAAAITSHFGDPASLGQRLVKEGSGHFGSGWVWLVARGASLEVLSTHDAGTPILQEGVTPLLTCDLWEHAYYIDYRQDRAGWLNLWCEKLANWDFAGQQYSAAVGKAEPWRYPAPNRSRSD